MQDDPTSDGVTPYSATSQATESATPVPQTGGATTANVPSVANASLPTVNTPRTLLRQTISGNQRGNWNITGSISITSATTNQQTITIDGSTSSITIASGGVISVGTNIVLDSAGGVISVGTNIVLDSASSSLLVTNTDGSIVGMGAIPDGSGDFGFFAQDSEGNLLYKIVGSTIYAYDITQNPHTNVMQILKLPDGTYGFAVATSGQNVTAGFD